VGRKATNAEVEQRVTVVVAMLLDGHSRSEITEYGSKKWGIDPRTIDDTYLPKARERIQADMDTRRKEYADDVLAMHFRLYAEAKHKGAYAAANRTLDMINRIMGTYAPTKSEVTGKDGQPVQISDPNMPDFSTWTFEQLMEWKKSNE
jgi:hypothetical protein